MLAAVEIHNKPRISYRYEIVVLLIINAWELLLKAYIYKFIKKVKLFNKDGTTKPFLDCVGCVFSNLGKDYLATKENLEILYKFRNDIAHFYTGVLDPVIFMLVKQNLIFYVKFLNDFFKIDITSESNLFLLPIGFKPLYTPVDYLSNQSISESYPPIIRSFIDTIVSVSHDLHDKGVDESIISDFSVCLINKNRVKNADIVVGIAKNPSKNSRQIVIKKNVNVNGAGGSTQSKIVITRNKSESSGIVMHEELSESLFDEINNIISANILMSPSHDQFYLGEEVYYRIYAECEHVDQDEDIQLLLAKTALTKYYAPCIYWFLNLDADICSSLLLSFIENLKSPYVHSFLRIIILLGENISSWFEGVLMKRYKNHAQPPGFYWTYKKMRENKNIEERRLWALRMSVNQQLNIPGEEKTILVNDLLNNQELASKYLSKACMDVFKGEKNERSIARTLDILAYGKLIEEKAEKIANSMNI